MFVKNPVYICPVQRETDSNPAAKAVNDFHHSGGLILSVLLDRRQTDGRSAG
jgi:hypothetical protein